ncbi:MAG TPA: cytochrome P450 [Thermoanaerobaculia bacterium]|nr:cytochrome P450 [Thermoanaerobaculia bacterium]
MAKQEPDAYFRQEPLLFLDRAFPAAGDSVWLPGRQLCVSEAAAARAVLTNDERLYEEHSDFFHTKRGLFGPRSVQVEMGRSARALLRAHLRAHAAELPQRIERELAPTSEWPDAGNWLLYRHLGGALVSPDSPVRLRRTLEEIVERAVLAGARQRYSRLTRAVFRFRVIRELARAVHDRRARRAQPPADVLDAMVAAAGSDVPAAELAELFLSFLFAVAGSVGFVLGWSVYLLGTHPRTEAKPAWVVQEALRLWPVAWMLGRRPARSHEVAGAPVTPRDLVVVCPYAVHRNPKHWDDPDSFRPERWAADHDSKAFIPFGWGPHRCVAATLSMQLVEDILRILGDRFRATVTPRTTRPCIGAALAPPRFTLDLDPLDRNRPPTGGERR